MRFIPVSKAIKVVALSCLLIASVAANSGAAGEAKAAAKPVLMVSGSIVVSPDKIRSGESTHLKWNSFDATCILISPSIGSVAPAGEIVVSPTETTTYVMTIGNSSGGIGTASATLTVSGSTSTDSKPHANAKDAKGKQ